MEKRERLEHTLAGETTDRPPVALWRSFAGDDLRAADYAQAVIDFQFAYDWDICVVVPPWGFAGGDYGLTAEWQGAPSGEGVAVRRPIKRSLDWTELRLPDPTRGEFGKLAAAIAAISDAMRLPATPVVVGVLSPLAQAARLAGHEVLIRHLRTRPDRLKTGLNILADGTARFLDSLKPLNIAGVYLMIEHADFGVLSAEEYATFGLPGDEMVLSGAPRSAWLRMAYVRGSTPMLKQVAGLGMNWLGWDDRTAEPDLQAAKGIWDGAVFGGLDAEKDVRGAAPSLIRDAAREALNSMGGRRLMVGCAAPCLMTTPRSHWRAVRLAVEK